MRTWIKCVACGGSCSASDWAHEEPELLRNARAWGVTLAGASGCWIHVRCAPIVRRLIEVKQGNNNGKGQRDANSLS